MDGLAEAGLSVSYAQFLSTAFELAESRCRQLRCMRLDTGAIRWFLALDAEHVMSFNFWYAT